ncbi:MAG: type II toxin-antitoxin system YoeB family toxin [Lachnospiraceae bacterium]|nr:type II toxin-antitoxin system YoeB family toxin [Lachnospiraceae bacterium]
MGRIHFTEDAWDDYLYWSGQDKKMAFREWTRSTVFYYFCQIGAGMSLKASRSSSVVLCR